MMRWLGMFCSLAVSMVLCCAMASGQTCTSTAEPAREQMAGVTVSTNGLRVPEKAWRHFYKAAEEAQAGRSREADREIVAALAIAPNFAEPYVLKASQEVAVGQFAEAAADAVAARRIDPGAIWAAVILAGAYSGMRRYQEAASVLSGLSQSQSSLWQVKYEMARAAVGLGDASEALRWSALAAEVAPASCIDTKLLRADAFILARRWKEAVVQLTVYMQSEQPQFHRAEVLKVLNRVRRLAAQEEIDRVASTEAMER